MALRIGTAGWSIPRSVADRFAGDGTHLQRYAGRLNAVEINSSFYRPHQQKTYARWAGSTPPHFRFAVKLPKQITHELRLTNFEAPLEQFLDETSGLGEKLQVILVQLPPSLAFEAPIAIAFIEAIRRATDRAIVLEPRHATWFDAEVNSLLQAYRISRVAADPPPIPTAAEPGGDLSTIYYRLHGSPRIYYSDYDAPFLSRLATTIATQSSGDVWCIFDNTALGAAAGNALDLQSNLKASAATNASHSSGIGR